MYCLFQLLYQIFDGISVCNELIYRFFVNPLNVWSDKSNQIIVYVLLGISPASNYSWPTFRNPVSVPSSKPLLAMRCHHIWKWDVQEKVGAKCSLKFLQCDLLSHLVENKWFCSLEDLGDEERRSPVTFLRNAQPLKMELTQGSETSANYNLTPGKYPKEHIHYSDLFWC